MQVLSVNLVRLSVKLKTRPPELPQPRVQPVSPSISAQMKYLLTFLQQDTNCKCLCFLNSKTLVKSFYDSSYFCTNETPPTIRHTYIFGKKGSVVSLLSLLFVMLLTFQFINIQLCLRPERKYPVTLRRESISTMMKSERGKRSGCEGEKEEREKK